MNPAAFRVGEYARLADVPTLQRLQAEFADRLITPPEMASHSGKRVKILSTQGLIGGFPEYRFEEVPGSWMEGSIVDLCFDPEYKGTHAIYSAAHETYSASADVSEGPGLVSIHDHLGRLFLCFRDLDAAGAASTINRVAQMRGRAAFETMYGFDGCYPSDIPEATDS